MSKFNKFIANLVTSSLYLFGLIVCANYLDFEAAVVLGMAIIYDKIHNING